MRPWQIVALTPAGLSDAAIAVAASRAGGTGLLDLEFTSKPDRALQALADLRRHGRGSCGVRLDSSDAELAEAVLSAELAPLTVALLTASDLPAYSRLAALARARGLQVWAEVTTAAQAEEARESGVEALVACGNEAGGWVAPETTFIFLQRLLADARLPVLARGGIGLPSAAACRVAGAAGVVLDSQLFLTRESRLPPAVKASLERMEGTETSLVGAEVGHPFRLFAPPGTALVEELRQGSLQAGEARAAGDSAAAGRWREAVRQRVAWDQGPDYCWPLGEDAGQAAVLAGRYVTVGGVLQGLAESTETHVRTARRLRSLAPDAPLALSHGTRLPVVQGPMSRITDRPEFARAVAEAGGLPFLALGLAGEKETEALLRETARLLSSAPWGVGLLGFAPPELREAQTRSLLRHRPRFALLAGGRPDQARALEQEGISTYLHAPSPRLLELFLREGMRRFVLEGRECGGHLGPLAAFPLWNAAVEVVQRELSAEQAGECHLLFAGGIHDARSASMVAALSAPLAARGVKVGVVLGSAYLFTREAVETAALSPLYQAQAREGRATVVLESSPGHAIRCLPTAYAEEFASEKRRLLSAGQPLAEVTAALGLLQMGRLRLAARGLVRGESGQLRAADPEEQVQRGAFMVGELAALRHDLTTIKQLHHEVCEESTHLLGRRRTPAPSRRRGSKPERQEIAIIGMAGLLPGAPNVRQYWDNILDGVCAIREVPDTYWRQERWYSPDRSVPDHTYSRWGCFLDPEPFDPLEWGIPPTSLPAIDSMQLLGLICAREAMRDAGYLQRPFDRSRAAVIMGVSGGIGQLGGMYVLRAGFPILFGAQAGQFLERAGTGLPTWSEDSFPGIIPNVVPGRIANRLDLSGPNYAVDAACASSLAAVSAALKELKLGDVDLALVGGVDVAQGAFGYLCFSATQALSPRGQASVFDADADGLVTGEGAAMLVLKRRADAERDGDRIYALVQGVGNSSDGRARGLTAPHMEGQLLALRRAYRQCGLSPAAVGMFEAHGTGTVAGDRTEAEALRTLVEEVHARPRSQAVGSVKSMIGHTKAAAGAAGLIKVALALHHHILPPTLGIKRPLPGVGFEDGPLYLNTETRPWLRPAAAQPRLAGVSSFGFGGTNFHLILEEYEGGFLGPEQAPRDRWPAELLVWTGASRAALGTALGEIAAQLEQGAAPELRDLAYTLWQQAAPLLAAPGGPRPVLALVAHDLGDLREKLQAAQDRLAQASPLPWPRGVCFAEAPVSREGRLAFLFPGQGSQYPNMLREMAVIFPEVREAFEAAQEALAQRLPVPLGQLVFPAPAFTPEEEQGQREAFLDTRVSQPALGAASQGLLHLLERLGVRADLVAGHSAGEYAALGAAGVFDDAALACVAEARGRCFVESQEGEPGAMLVAQAGREQIAAALEGLTEVWIANVNSPTQTVLTGSRAGVQAVSERLATAGVQVRPVPVTHAFHSPLMRVAQGRLAQVLADTPLAPPQLEVFSNTTAGLYPSDPDQMRALLVEHCALPVEFVAEIEAMYAAGARVFVEVGPRAVLTHLVSAILSPRPHLAVATDQPEGGLAQFLVALGQLLAHGRPLSLDRLFAGRTVRSLDLAALASETATPALSPNTWLVNGCRAWPADQPTPLCGDGILLRAGEELPALLGGAARRLPPGEDGSVLARHREFLREVDEADQEVLDLYAASLAHPGAGDLPAPGEALQERLPDVPAREEDILPALLTVVSERTGYPPGMLGPDLHMEADLGIDSIKRMEILAVVQSEYLPGSASLSTPEMEELLQLATLRQLSAWLGDHLRPGAPAPQTAPEAARPAAPAETRRLVLGLAPAPELPVAAPRFEADRVVLITDDEGGVAQAFAALVRASGGRPVVVRHRREGAPPEGAPYQADLTSPEAVRTLLARVGADEGSPCALVHLLPLAPGLPGADLTLEDWRERARREVKALFYLSQAAVGNLRAPTPGGRTWLVAALASDTWPEHGGVAGFLGTAAREWPEVICKAVDFAPPVAPTEVAERLLSEMAAGDSRVRVRYEAERRLQPSADLRALDEALPAALTPDSDWVFLLTGGARGITAEVALELAERYQPTLVLLGRSAPPAEESAATAGLATPSELKLALLEEIQGSGPAVGVREVETAYRRLLQDREMRENLAALRQTGARVSYQQVDVRDETALAELIRKIEAEHGRLDVVIHGAGVIEDKLIADKQPASFDRVFDTKTDGAFLLSRLLNPDTLRCLILFTSVAGPLGNPGQSDYAAANEVLAELAAHLDRAWPARVVALHWGPWARRGMVTAELEAALAQQGLALIAPEAGRALCVRELTHGAKGEPRVVLAAGPAVEAWGAAAPGPRPSARTLVPRPEEDGRELPLLHRANVARRGADELELVRVLDPAYDLYLDHHRLGGRAVLPMTFALELMAETAKALVPGREVTQVRDLHVLRGIVLDGTSARVRVRARREGGPDPDGVTTVTVELAETERNGHANYRMNLELRESFPDPPRVPRAGELEPFEMPVAEIYRRYLFHGPLLQGLVAIEGLGLGGASGVITSSSPQELLADAPPGEWVLDPMRFDSALQLGYVWALRQWGVSSLPARFASCRLFAPTGSGQVRCLMTGSSHNGGLAQRADMSMVDLQGRVLMLIEGFEAYGSKTLNLRADERR